MSQSDRLVHAGVIGTGQYATAIVTQAESIPNLNVSVIADHNLDAAHNAYQLAGVDEDLIVVAGNQSDALKAFESGKKVVLEDANLMMELPIDVIAEGTGNPTAGAQHAISAINNGKHVVMVTKEVDICIGPLLRQMAQSAGLVYTAADGDQPSHLISLIDWCREIGLEVLCGGKFGEKNVIIDIPNRQIRYRRGETRELTEEEANLFRHFEASSPEMYETIEKRKALLGNSIDVRTDDLTEQGIVANATGLTIERERFHHPVAWPTEMPIVLAPQSYGGILEGRGVVEQTTYLRADHDTSMGGGVYVTVHAENEYSRKVLSGKGHIGNPDDTSYLIFRPYHLCGVETPYSILSAALRNTPTSGWSMEQRYDSFGRAKQDIPAGTHLDGAHSVTWETFLAPAVKLANTATTEPMPYHIATGSRLTEDIKAGTVMTQVMVENIATTPLWKLRTQQDNQS
jgi:predicted homoserine dehydrogenase-like protein